MGRTTEAEMALAMAVVAAMWSFAQAAMAFENVTTMRFDQGFSPLFGEKNVLRSDDDRTVRLLLDRRTGSGFISSDLYSHGFFSAKIKLPSDYTAGVVVAFYTSNGDVFEKNHDELDFEFLGNVRGREWKIQTNVYGNGSTSRGREERYLLPFDPSAEAHRYSILWTEKTIIFYVDDTPIREVRRSAAMAGDYPSKPMSLYATIWDGSTWATAGGRYKVKYKYAPFVAEFTDLTVLGCRMDPIEMVSTAGKCKEEEAKLAGDFVSISPERRAAMKAFREKQMTYSFCYDSLRYPVAFPDCHVAPSERERFKESGHLKFGGAARRRRRPAVAVPSSTGAAE
ncbi:putative xyloglucan endotransglucosylase/hydrolase protein 30 [Wolffia australiana]